MDLTMFGAHQFEVRKYFLRVEQKVFSYTGLKLDFILYTNWFQLWYLKPHRMTGLFSPCLTNLKSCYFFSKLSPREVCPVHSIIWYFDVVFKPLRLMVSLLNTLPLYQCPAWKVCNVELHTAFKCHPITAMGHVTIWILYKYKTYFFNEV